MKRYFLYFFSILCVQASAQHSDTLENGGIKIYKDKEFSKEEMSRMRHQWDIANMSHLGLPYRPFEALTLDSQVIKNETFKGKVTLFFFWYPSCGCYDIAELKAVYDRFKDDPSFDMVIITFERDALADYLKENPLPFKFGLRRWMSEVKSMNYHNSFPSYLVVNKDGIVVKFNPAGTSTGLDPEYIAASVKNVLDKY